MTASVVGFGVVAVIVGLSPTMEYVMSRKL